MRKLLLSTVAAAGTLLAAGAAHAQAASPVAPGTVKVHLNGYLQYMFGVVGGNGMSGGSGATSYKNNSLGTIGDVRLYPGFDGMTTNGIAYGAQVELRTALSSANGNGVNGNSASSNGVNGLYVRRAYGYLGTAEYGYARFGQTDGAFTLMQYGVIEQFGDGAQWTADGGLINLLPSGHPGNFIYADQGALYTTDKIVYISPSIQDPVLDGKFGFIVSFEPNSNGIKEGASAISSSSSELNSAVAGGSASRRRNTFDAMAGYSVKAGAFDTKLSVGYLRSSPLGNTTGAQAYSPMGVFQAGIQTTITGLFTNADNITLGANVKSGSVVDGYQFKKKGGRDAMAYIVGASYVNGPYALGASFFDSQEANGKVGAEVQGHTLSEYGVAVGANYVVAKPMSLFVQYMYGNVHGSTATTLPHGNSHAQGVAAGATIKW